jgi:hypothetical protein
VSAVVVVEPDIVCELSAEARLLGDQEAGEGELPALVEDDELHPFDATVGLGTPDLDATVLGSENLSHRRDEVLRDELGSVVAADRVELPVPLSQVIGDSPSEL